MSYSKLVGYKLIKDMPYKETNPRLPSAVILPFKLKRAIKTWDLHHI